jgi:hypothetical protein
MGAAAMGALSTMETTSTVRASSAIEATSATESASVMEAAFTVEALSAAESTPVVEAAFIMKATFTVEVTAAIEVTFVAEATPEVAGASVEAWASIEAMGPWAGADKYITCEPIRSVVAIRCARVWVIRIVAIGACGWWTIVSRAANSKANHNPLCMCKRRRTKANPKYRENSQVSHIWIPSESPRT